MRFLLSEVYCPRSCCARALAGFGESKKSGSIKRLVKFQSENKLLLTAYGQRELSILGRIVANQERKPYKEMVKSYEKYLFEALRRPPKLGSNINVLMKAMGYFSKSLTTEEKSSFSPHSISTKLGESL